QGTGYCAGAGTDSPVGAVSYGGPARDTPVNNAAPRISAKPLVGRLLTASRGTWKGNPTAYVYQWETCTTTGCTAIPGATSRTYTPTRDELGQKLAVVVYAANAFGSSPPASSARSAAVAKPQPKPHKPPRKHPAVR